MRVKICGITNLADALHAIEMGADALGFVFYPPSPRYISPQKAREIIEKLPPFVEKVGLFVNESASSIDSIAKESGISLAQIHFDIDPQELSAIETPTLPVIRAKSSADISKYVDRYRLGDAYCEAYGGSGKRLNLEWFRGRDCSKIILAGGLSSDNLIELRGYGFYGVDVSSATEAQKGIKDPIKVEKFIYNAKNI